MGLRCQHSSVLTVNNKAFLVPPCHCCTDVATVREQWVRSDAMQIMMSTSTTGIFPNLVEL